MATDRDIAFPVLPPRDIAALSRRGTPREVHAGEVLFAEGDRDIGFFVVLDGRLMVLDGHTPIATLGPGDFFGEIALVESRPRTATVRAEGIARLMVIGHREFHALMDEFPDVRRAVMDALAERVRQNEGR